MYSYNECFAYMHWLMGDNEVLPYIGWVANAHEQNDEPTRWSPDLGGWTERHTAFRLLSNVLAVEVLGDATYRSNVIGETADFIWHQNGADGQIPASRVDGGLYHFGRQHGDGVETALVGSSWMTALTVDAMVRGYALTEDARIANFIRRVGNFERAACKTDPDHNYDNYDGRLTYPDYMMNYDGASDPQDGRDSGMVDHALDVAGPLAWAAYFGHLLGSPDSSFVQKATELYFTYDTGVNFWTRPAAPPERTAFRVSPWRKWGWEHRTTGSFSWLMKQISASENTRPRRRP